MTQRLPMVPWRLGDLLLELAGDFRIITKVGETYDPTQVITFRNRDSQKLEQSLQRLNRDRLDVVLLHSDGKDIEHLNQGALQTLIKVRDQGLIQAVGLSGKTVEGGRHALNQGADCLMITLNLKLKMKNRSSLRQSDMAGLLVKKAFGSGHLTTSIPEILKTVRALKHHFRYYWHH